MVKFVFGKQDNEEGVLSIETTKPLPKIKNRVKEFSVSDGLFKFQHVRNKTKGRPVTNMVTGRPLLKNGAITITQKEIHC